MKEKRYKVLIADDEYWTREKLRSMIEWENYSLEVLEPAQDGAEVLERMDEEQPDILITDINMPFVNGVELLSAINERYKDVVTFVVSGYDDFEYVRSTFLSGAINYLVKPVTKIDMVNAIVKALEIISERENEKMQLLKAASLLQDQEFSQLIQKDETSYIPDISINNNMELAGVSLMLIKIHNTYEITKQYGHDMNLFSYNIKREIRRIIGKEDIIVFNHIYRSSEFVVITEMGESEMIKASEHLRIYFKKFPQACLTFCISGHSYSMDSIHMAYVEAVALLMTRKFCKKDQIISSDAGQGSKSKTEVVSHFSAEHEKQVKHYLKAGNARALEKLIIVDIRMADCEKETWSYLEVRQTVKQITNMFIEYAIAVYGHKGAADIENLTEAVDKAVEHLDAEAVCGALKDIIGYLVPEDREAPTDTMKGTVRQAAKYVDQHYFEEITLASLAEMYHVEPTYFSKVFRQEIGENLILYLTQKRIEKAKEYMQKAEINLTEVAFMVGYDDYTYFSRVFRKNTGHSPREYRSRCLEGEA